MKSTFFSAIAIDSLFAFEVFRFDRSGTHKAVIYRSEPVYPTSDAAEKAAAAYCVAAGLDAEKKT